jgi:heme/copper-type cytochrome/quinol oxidase subunit 4
MNWLVWLGLAVVITAVAAVTGSKAKGTRPVAHTRMMGVARVVLVVVVLIFVYLAYRARSG